MVKLFSVTALITSLIALALAWRSRLDRREDAVGVMAKIDEMMNRKLFAIESGLDVLD